MRHHRHFLGETINVIGLPLEIGERDKQREVSVLNARRLDPVIHQPLNAFPDAIAPRLDHHAATHTGFLGKISGAAHLLVPFGEVVGAPGVQRVADVGHEKSAFCCG